MGEWRNAALQTAFWTYANSLRREAKLCDIILYVQGRKGAMVGYPAHKLLLISASKYFKLLFEREDLRNFCHFPHLSEDGLFTVLDIVYGREIPDSVNMDDALMAARFLQVDCAVEELEAKREALEAKARASPKIKPSNMSGTKRKAEQSPHRVDRAPSRESDSSQRAKFSKESPARPPPHSNEAVEMRVFKNLKTSDSGNNTPEGSDDHTGFQSLPSHESSQSQDDQGGEAESQDRIPIIKTEPDVDLTVEEDDDPGLQHLGFGQGGMYPGQTYGQMQLENVSGQNESGLVLGDGQFMSDSFMGDPNSAFGNPSYSADMGSVQIDGKPLQCDICGKVFATPAHLEEHRAVQHTERRKHSVFPCLVCGKVFSRKRYLKQHRRQHEDPRIKCSICGEMFRWHTMYYKHMKTMH